MAFSRAFLKTTGLTDEQISAVMEEHVAVTDALKKDRDTYKEQAATIPDLQKQIEGFNGGEDWKSKYDDVKKAFEDFKKDQTAKETANKIKAQYRKLLIEEKTPYQELGAPNAHVPPSPFLRPAVENHRAEINKIMEEELKKA